MGAPRQAGAAGRTLAWENGGAVSADLAAPGPPACASAFSRPRPPSRWRAWPVSPPKPRANPGPALAHLTLHQRRRGSASGASPAARRAVRSADSWGRGFSAGAGRLASLKAGGDHPRSRWGHMPTASVGSKLLKGRCGAAGNVPGAICSSLNTRQNHPPEMHLDSDVNVAVAAA